MVKSMTRRVRNGTPRSTTGCSNCRQRRIKCDETEPSCERCRRSGWNCPGYSRSSSESVGTPKDLVSTQSAIDLTITQYSLPFKVPGSKEERQSLHYFCNFAAADLTGYFPSTFWSRTVLQRCQHDVPIRHAAAALGRVHREHVIATTGFAPSQDTLEAYRKSVKALRNYLGRQSNPDPALVLICSAIFFCFELICGERQTALRHLQSGLAILKEWQAAPAVQSASTGDKEELLDVFKGLDLQATMFDDGRVPTLQIMDPMPEISLSPFPSFDEMQRSLSTLIHNTLFFTVKNVPYKFADSLHVPEPILRQRQSLLHRFEIWEKKTKLFEYESRGFRHDESNSKQRTKLTKLKLHHRIVKLLLLHCLQDEIMECAPSFDDEADSLLELARIVVSSDVDDTAEGFTPMQRRCFYLQVGIVAPVFLLAMKTTKPQVVEAAIDLLQSVNGRREGFYDAQQMAEIATGLAQRQLSCEGPQATYPFEEDLVSSGDVLPRSLEWTAEEFMDVDVHLHRHDEEARWKGLGKLLFFTA